MINFNRLPADPRSLSGPAFSEFEEPPSSSESLISVSRSSMSQSVAITSPLSSAAGGDKGSARNDLDLCKTSPIRIRELLNELSLHPGQHVVLERAQ
eukprot:CAMPEP_0116572708 /NCGR_PEP_ID=MMETSP0397-20121206/18332_1 /TAXON_ID=216820 /ORGANISM="Cyclophora tenuis, Strain ECT3854" /LENGTH=96 /DNA_ID=CAMNT_0004101079 /DNA_START=253 /DNA_END=543 /DNA_ORIENTATION=-